MSDKTGIEWTDATWNPVTGCSKVSQGCKHCYAKHGAWTRLSAMPNTVYFGREFEQVSCHSERLDQPIRWKRPRRIFVNSMSDLFHEDVPFEFITDVFVTMALADQHVFQVLTKRPARMLEYLKQAEIDIRDAIKYESKAETMQWPLPNVWVGISAEDQATADDRIPFLLQTPAAVRWISAEPLLGSIEIFSAITGELQHASGDEFNPGSIDWVVVGGESGNSARPMSPDWVRSLRDQCKAAGVPFLFKQWGEWIPMLGQKEGLPVKQKTTTSDGWVMGWAGKKSAGRLLDGLNHDGYPKEWVV